jgi:hypothetical protein
MFNSILDSKDGKKKKKKKKGVVIKITKKEKGHLSSNSPVTKNFRHE